MMATLGASPEIRNWGEDDDWRLEVGGVSRIANATGERVKSRGQECDLGVAQGNGRWLSLLFRNVR